MPSAGSNAPQAHSARALIFLGPPGSGKGTQAKELVKVLHVPHLSTGDMFRDNIARATPLGLRARPIMERGELVPDDITLGMVEERIAQPDCANGFVFDGFPRTSAQAERLAELLRRRGFGLPLVLHLVVPREELVRRLSGRLTCPKCGDIYNRFDHPPKVEGKCDRDGAGLVQRADDQEDVVRGRLLAFEQQTSPLVEYYRRQGVLHEIDGRQDRRALTQQLLELIGRK